jgi:hypothetical protein
MAEPSEGEVPQFGPAQRTIVEVVFGSDCLPNGMHARPHEET